ALSNDDLQKAIASDRFADSMILARRFDMTKIQDEMISLNQRLQDMQAKSGRRDQSASLEADAAALGKMWQNMQAQLGPRQSDAQILTGKVAQAISLSFVASKQINSGLNEAALQSLRDLKDATAD